MTRASQHVAWGCGRWLAALALASLLLAGCQETAAIVDPVTPAPLAQLPSYRDIALRYNQNLEGFDRLFARADVQVVWFDEHQKRHVEIGDDSMLCLRQPSALALSVGKLGHDALWAGYDAERYWWFDIDQGRAFVGRHDNLGKPGTRRLPAPVHPLDLPQLLGLIRLDPATPPHAPQVEWAAGGYLVEPPGTRARIVIHPETYTPIRVDLCNRLGNSVVIARLAQPKRVPIDGVPVERQPWVASVMDVTLPGKPDRVTLSLRDFSTQAKRFRPQLFDFDALLEAHEPKRIVDLDAKAE